MPQWQMQLEAEQIAERCVRATKTHRLSHRAKDVALVAIMLLPEEEEGSYRQSVIREYRRLNPQCNPFFIYFVLPVLANLISSWMIRWIFRRKRGVSRLRAEAFDLLG